ncbi:MAG: type II toxin-antitoxin system PemK/MazF family toxin [Thermoleophilia bacterium]|nr:type II toxin-antitoxin system PemK/MazF family toxin [Thermoleophilia bacterium]
MNRGDVFDADLAIGHHPVVVITRDVAIPVLANVTVALVTSRVRGFVAEVPVGAAEGLDRDCVVNCHDLSTIPKRTLTRQRGRLGPEARRHLDDALRIALDLD